MTMEEKSNAENTAAETSDGSPAKKTTSKSKAAPSKGKQQSKASHPRTSEMVNAAIRELKDRKGSSLQAIKKYIASTYKVDGEKIAPFIKRYLKLAVTSGAIVQTKGKGASGSFKLSVAKGSETKAKTPKAAKVVAQPKKAKKSVEKKTTSPRKPAAVKKASPAKKTEAAKKASTPKKAAPAKTEKVQKTEKAKPVAETKAVSKTRKTAKAPAAKTKTPKPKRTAASRTAKSPAKK